MSHEIFREFWALLGFTYMEHGKFDKARVVFELLKGAFDDVNSLKALSYICLKTGRYEEALAYADAFIKRCEDEKKRKTAFLLKSRALWALGRREEARQYMKKFLDGE